jgi:hypothetical protein
MVQPVPNFVEIIRAQRTDIAQVEASLAFERRFVDFNPRLIAYSKAFDCFCLAANPGYCVLGVEFAGDSEALQWI